MNSAMENMLTRRSVRSFKQTQIPKEDLHAILRAASYAPSAMGMQSWQFTAIQNANTLQKANDVMRQTLLSIPVTEQIHPYLAILRERAQQQDVDFLYHAPTYVIVSNLKENENAMADCALALGNMMLAAHSLGVGSCWLNQLSTLTNTPLVRALLSELGVPENHDVYGTLAMGYAAEQPKPAAPRKDVIRVIA